MVGEGEVAVARLCGCVSRCPRCDGSGFERTIEDGSETLERCTCFHVSRVLQRYSRTKIPARMARKHLSNFDFSLVSTRVVSTTSRYINDFVLGEMNRGLVLYGDVGRGKTHLMAAMVRSLVVEHGVTARFVEFSHLLADLKSSFGRGGGAANLIEPLVKVDVLAIDELGKGRNTEFEGTVLDELVSRRYNAGRTILATTNYQPGPSTGLSTPDFTTGKRPALTDRVGDRVYSRLCEMCEMLPMEGTDYRQTIVGSRR